ncbi:MAG: beta-ketoacyl synthase N-terminal-like domain-containing protein [Verrucomicrobiales bacterium]
MKITIPISITGLGCLSSLGNDVQAHLAGVAAAPTGFSTLAELGETPRRFDDTLAAWIHPRSSLVHRMWAPASCATLQVAKEAIAEAGWSASDLRDTCVIFGTSRGSVAGWLSPWPTRRPFEVMAASNSLAAEPAAAVCRELGVAGNWQVISNGCCAGLDALGTAALWLQAGLCQRILAISCDLPLVEPILEAYRASGILATRQHPGLVPSEGAAAICMETQSEPKNLRLTYYASAAEPSAILGASASLPALEELLHDTKDHLGAPDLALLHSSGTPKNAKVEGRLLADIFSPKLPTVSLKRYTGHCIGASGLLETAIGCAVLRQRRPIASIPLNRHSSFLKIASAMGGKHTIARIDHPHD